MVVEQVTGDAHAADIRGVAHRDQDFVLLQKIRQRDIFIRVAKREGDDAGAIAAIFRRDDVNVLLLQSRDEMSR